MKCMTPARATGWMLICALLPLVLAAPVAVRGQQSREVRSAIPVADSSRKLGVGDQVTFQVVEDKDPPVRLVVTDAGELDVPYLGRVKVAGRTLGEARSIIKSALENEYYHNATVKLAIDSVAKSSGVVGTVYLSGNVRTTGPQELLAGEEATAGKIILRAGGLTEFADSRKVKIVRKGGEGRETETIVVDLKEVLERGRVDKDVRVFDGDLIIVPQRFLNF